MLPKFALVLGNGRSAARYTLSYPVQDLLSSFRLERRATSGFAIRFCEWKAELPIARKTETDIRWKEKVGRF